MQFSFPRLGRLRDTELETQSEGCDAVNPGETSGLRRELLKSDVYLASVVVQTREPWARAENEVVRVLPFWPPAGVDEQFTGPGFSGPAQTKVSRTELSTGSADQPSEDRLDLVVVDLAQILERQSIRTVVVSSEPAVISHPPSVVSLGAQVSNEGSLTRQP